MIEFTRFQSGDRYGLEWTYDRVDTEGTVGVGNTYRTEVFKSEDSREYFVAFKTAQERITDLLLQLRTEKHENDAMRAEYCTIPGAFRNLIQAILRKI